MSAFFFLLMRVYDRPSVSRTRETVAAGPSSEPDAERAGTNKGKARADSSAVGPAGMQFAPSDPSIHHRPIPESAGLPATPPRPGIIDPEFRGPNNEDDEDEASSLDDHPPNPQSRRVTSSSWVIADSPGPLYYDEQGVVHVVDEDIDAMLSRLDDERRASGDSGRGAEMPEGVALPAGGIDWVPPNILLEYDWIQDIGAETVDDAGQPAPPPLRYGLRLFRRFTRVFPPVAEQDDGRPWIPHIMEQEPQDDGHDDGQDDGQGEPAVVDQ